MQNTLSLVISAATGTYRVPGNVETLQVARSFEVVPPSTVAGCIESLCGKSFGTFAAEGNQLAYGKTREPLGRATILRLETQYYNIEGQGDRRQRPCFNEVLFDVEYRVAVRGPWVESGLLDMALAGAVPRKYILSLGESDDLVTQIQRAEPSIKWLKPVPYWEAQMRLPLKVNKTKEQPRPYFGEFAWTQPSVEVPEDSWLAPGGEAFPKSRKKP